MTRKSEVKKEKIGQGLSLSGRALATKRGKIHRFNNIKTK
jgi:hypothetical protein